MVDVFYERKREHIFKTYSKLYKHTEKALQKRFDEKTALAIRTDTERRIEKIIGQLPEVGGNKNQFIQVVLINAWYIPFFKASAERGLSAEEYVTIMARAFHAEITKYPVFLRHIGGMVIKSSYFARRMKKHAEISQKREFEKNWVYTASTRTERDDARLKVEYSQCAVCLMMEEFEANELLPYCNVADFIMAKSLGFGFENPNVLGRGDRTCIGLFRSDDKCEIPGYLEFAFKGLDF